MKSAFESRVNMLKRDFRSSQGAIVSGQEPPMTHVEALAEIQRLRAEKLHIVFEDFPGPDNKCVFVEVETPNGKSVNAGDWHKRSDGFVELRLIAEKVPDFSGLWNILDAAKQFTLRAGEMMIVDAIEEELTKMGVKR